jgi:mannosyltransferase
LQILTLDQLKPKVQPILKRLTLSRTQQVLLALIVVGTIFRLYLLGGKSIWLDEAFSISISQRSLIDVLRMTLRTDTHPPLYYLMLKIWLLFSQREVWVRLLSALFSIASIPVMYLLVNTMYKDKRAGLLGATILVFSPFQIWYAQETRMYAALTFFVLLSAYFFIRALQTGSIVNWMGYIIATVLALYTDNGAIWYLVTLVVFSLLSNRLFRHRAVGWLISHLAIAFLYAFWLPFLIMQTRQVTEGFWLPPPSFQIVLGTFLDFHSYNFPVIEISLLYMATIFVFAYIVPGKSWQRQLASLWLFLPLGISLLLSLRQPIFLSRNLIAASLGYYLLATDTIWKFQSRKAVMILLIPLLVMNLVSIGYNTWFAEKEDWRDAARMIATASYDKPDGLVVFIPGFAELPFEYYFKNYDRSIETQGYPGDELLLHPQPKEVTDIQELLSGRPYVWLVVRQGESLDPEWLQIKIWLDSHGYVRYPGLERKNISVLSYVRWDKVKPGRTPTHIRTQYKAFVPLILKERITREYVVQPGETLLEIAIRFQTTVEALAEANQLDNPNKLTPGQTLIIP